MVTLVSFREERAIKRKNKILRAAAELFNEKGYHGTTIEDIARKLRVTKGSIYYYVESKDDLLYQCHTMVAARCIIQIQQIIAGNFSPQEKLEMSIESLIRFITEEKAVFNVINRPNILPKALRAKVLAQRDQYDSLFESIIDEGIKKKVFYSDNPKLSRLLILGAVNSMVYWFSSSGKSSSHEIARFFAKSLVKTLYKSP